MFQLNDIFSGEPVNRGRQPELDLAKAVITFTLAFVHCIIECTPEENLVSGIPFLFDSVIGGPLSAPMFMFAMGVGMVYTKKDHAGELAKRGLRLVIAGFVLNLCRYTLPYLLGYAVTGNHDKFIAPLLYRTLCNDILQFAGLAMILTALLKKWKVPAVFMFALSLGMSAAGMLLNGVDLGSPMGNILLGHLIGTEDAAGMVISDFPVLNWFIVPVSGYLFGSCLIRVKDKKRFYMLLSPVCAIATVIYFTIGIKNAAGMFGEGQNCYYHITTSDVLISILAAVGILGIYYAVAGRIPGRLMYWIQDISKNITRIYCLQWVILVPVTNVLLYAARGTQELPTGITLLLSLAISMAAITAAHLWSARAQRRRRGQET